MNYAELKAAVQEASKMFPKANVAFSYDDENEQIIVVDIMSGSRSIITPTSITLIDGVLPARTFHADHPLAVAFYETIGQPGKWGVWAMWKEHRA